MWEYILEDCLREEETLEELKRRVFLTYQVSSSSELKKDPAFLEVKKTHNLDLRYKTSWLKLLHEI